MEALHGELLGRDKLRLGDDLLSRGAPTTDDLEYRVNIGSPGRMIA